MNDCFIIYRSNSNRLLNRNFTMRLISKCDVYTNKNCVKLIFLSVIYHCKKFQKDITVKSTKILPQRLIHSWSFEMNFIDRNNISTLSYRISIFIENKLTFKSISLCKIISNLLIPLQLLI